MLSPTATATCIFSTAATFLPKTHLLRRHLRTCPPPPTSRKPISATANPPPPPANQNLYQPFRPPPAPLPPQFQSLSAARRLEIVTDRLGLWHQYAPLIPSLYHDGFTPPSLEEATGISGVDQNRLTVAAQVRDSLLRSPLFADTQTLAFFDSSGSYQVLYELRFLSSAQRAAAARHAAAARLDPKAAQELARAIKDFPRQRGQSAWDRFDASLPGDCLAFMRLWQSREHRNPSPQRTAALQLAAEAAESEAAKAAIAAELGRNSAAVGTETEAPLKVPVVRLKMGEVTEASSVAILPVCRAEEREKELLEAPWECKSEGKFGAIVAEKGWRRWVVLPRWEPVATLDGGSFVAVAFPDARALPWKVNRWYKEEPILVVADRGRKEVAVDDGFYLTAVSSNNGDVFGSSGGLKVERGSVLKEMGVGESLGTVVLVVRPPKEEFDDQLSEEDWE